ncbi:hypothetical protein RUM43_014228 [Polyplax serrata]|uniref:Integrin beta n=1 Tax=Polyplax serrata TaxID=468196 RepID=A0AAN8PIF5_POLSC
MGMSYCRLSFTILLIICTAAGVTSQISEKFSSQNPCVSKQTCHECIQTPTCAWCSQPNFGDTKRCFQPNINIQSQCDEAYIVNPDNVFSLMEARSLKKASRAGYEGGGYEGGYEAGYEESHSYSSSGSYSSSSSFGSSSGSSYLQHEAVQISPQRVGLKLRINEPYRMDFSYAQAEDYPVDLYYLMDLSKSMEDDKDKLSFLGNRLAQTMQNITSNFRLGFGSFVDKVVMPYVSTVPKKLAEPCEGCEPPYGFKNHMPLNVNTSAFSGEVSNASVSGNLDAPEGGFDAIMQAIVCKNEIGWREKARKLLVFSTDAGFHYAGDGKLGGIVKPNDGECHLDSRGMYTHSKLQDYPSISQVNLKVKENSINVIFAVTADQFGVYEQLGENIEGASSGTLSSDSSNVVDLVKEQYDKISSSVEMKDTASSAVKVTYYSSCLGGGPPKQTNKCDGLKVGTVVNFSAEIEVASCPADKREWKQTFKIYPVGIQEYLVVDLEMLCECPCENPSSPEYEDRSQTCSGFGTYKCGICECDSSHFGRYCECDSENLNVDKDFQGGCRPDNFTFIDCSGRGTCMCGVCECEIRPDPTEVITGQFCECDNFSCDRNNGVLCSGSDHGTCVCGKCQCLAGWTGDACDCRASNDTCIPPEGGEICSGKGVCECGMCKCDQEEEGRYSGRYCEKCPTCPGRCLEFKECVQCQVYKTGPLTPEECAANCTFIPTTAEVIEANEERDENLCAYYDEEDCRFAYVYGYDELGKVYVRAQEKRDCPPKVYILGIVLGVIGAIVLIGLALLLCWKLCTTIHDRREFAKFEKDRMMAKWNTDENPIFKQATSTFKNPTYEKKGGDLKGGGGYDSHNTSYGNSREEYSIRRKAGGGADLQSGYYGGQNSMQVGKGDGYMQSGKYDGTMGRTTDLKSAGGYFESSKLEAQNAVGRAGAAGSGLAAGAAGAAAAAAAGAGAMAGAAYYEGQNTLRGAGGRSSDMRSGYMESGVNGRKSESSSYFESQRFEGHGGGSGREGVDGMAGSGMSGSGMSSSYYESQFENAAGGDMGGMGAQGRNTLGNKSDRYYESSQFSESRGEMYDGGANIPLLDGHKSDMHSSYYQSQRFDSSQSGTLGRTGGMSGSGMGSGMSSGMSSGMGGGMGGGSSTMQTSYFESQSYDGSGTLGGSKKVSGQGTLGGHGRLGETKHGFFDSQKYDAHSLPQHGVLSDVKQGNLFELQRFDGAVPPGSSYEVQTFREVQKFEVQNPTYGKKYS